jgi:hypothetical protein
LGKQKCWSGAEVDFFFELLEIISLDKRTWLHFESPLIESSAEYARFSLPGRTLPNKAETTSNIETTLSANSEAYSLILPIVMRLLEPGR